MSEIAFLCTDHATAEDGFEPVFRSPLRRALGHAGPEYRDLSGVGKIEARGEIDDLVAPAGAEVVRISAERALVLCAYEDGARVREELRSSMRSVVDLTGALGGIGLRGERLMRRLTALDLDALPAAGAVAHAPAIVLRDGDEFRVFFPQELGHYVAEVVLDAAAGL